MVMSMEDLAITRILLASFTKSRLFSRREYSEEMTVACDKLDVITTNNRRILVTASSSPAHEVSTRLFQLQATCRRLAAIYTRRLSQLSAGNLLSSVNVDPAAKEGLISREGFELICAEIFRERVNWGRIMCLFNLFAELAYRALLMKAGNSPVDLMINYVEWTVVYIQMHLWPWIEAERRWTGLLSFENRFFPSWQLACQEEVLQPTMLIIVTSASVVITYMITKFLLKA